MWIARPAASTIAFCGLLPLAPVIEASMACTWPVWQSRSGRPSCSSVWYQTTETLPGSPAATHGQNTRVPGWATVAGADHVLPRSFVEIIMIEFAAGVAAPLQPPIVPAWRSSVSHTRYTVPALSTAIDDQCPYIEVPRKPSCGVKLVPPFRIVLMPTPKLPSPCWKIAGSTTVLFGRSYASFPNADHEPPSESEPLSSIPVVVHVAPPSVELKTWWPLPLPSSVSVPMNTWFAFAPASQGRSPSWQSAVPLSQVCPPSTDEKSESLTRSIPVL